ncbi:MAG: hypothetical protein ACXVW4_03965 [Nocardioides sp.]
MRPSRTPVAVPLTLLALALAFALALAPTTPASAGAHRRAGGWAPAATAALHPGTQMFTAGAQCTANFVYADATGAVYLGYAAHCAGRGGQTDTDGCTTDSLPLGTPVRFAEGATAATSGTTVGHGTLAYSSWSTMHHLAGPGPNACAYNDLALVRVDPADVGTVNPSVPFWGGPSGVSTAGLPAGDRTWSWGQSSLRPTTALSPRTGASLGGSGHGWSWDVYTATPGIPGDSGSGFLDSRGRAVGVLSTITLAPLVGSNGLGDLARELAFAQAHSGIDGLRLVPGTVPFSPVA